jgi:nucleotide-binding universal stress UspA family protein
VTLRALSPGELQVVHVAPRPLMLMPRPYGGAPTPAELATAGRAWLEERVRGLPQATPVLLEGDPPHAACEHAAAAGVDLIVAAAHRGIVDRAMLGGFASYVAYHAPCPVLLVHPPPVGAPGAG